MLIEFRVGNFRSFKQEQILSLVASSDNTLPDNVAEVGGLKLLRVAAIYGPNASGKSNLIKAIEWSSEFIINSAAAKPDSLLTAVPFMLDEELRTKPSSFEFSIMLNGVRYQYGFHVDKVRVWREWLLAYPKRAQTWFAREFDETTGEYTWNFSDSLKWGARGVREKIRATTRKDVLFLSSAVQWNNDQLTSIYSWFKDNLRTLLTDARINPITADMLKNIQDDHDEVGSAMRQYFVQALRSADLGIEEIRVEEINEDRFALPENVSLEEKSRMLKIIKEVMPYDIRMVHKNQKTGFSHAFHIQTESDGTQRFFTLLGPWIELILEGMTAVLDELDRSLHPLLTRKLVELVQTPDIPGNNERQLIFSTHDTTLLDPELLRRDQIWLTQKDDAGATELCSLVEYDEHKVRKGEAMQKGYLSGKYGAIPILDRFRFSK